MGYETIKVKIEGLTPLLMHNGQLADELHPIVRAMSEITSKPKKKKTLLDLQEHSRLEFMGGIYVDEDGAPCIPGENLERCIRDGATNESKGKLSTAAVFVEGNWKLRYKGPKTVEELFEDKQYVLRKSVRIGAARVMRTRPIFTDWSLDFEVRFNAAVMDFDSIKKALDYAGEIKGLGDWRPRYGRFEVTQCRRIRKK